MKKIILIVSGVVLLAALITVLFFVLSRAGDAREASREQKTEAERASRASRKPDGEAEADGGRSSADSKESDEGQHAAGKHSTDSGKSDEGQHAADRGETDAGKHSTDRGKSDEGQRAADRGTTDGGKHVSEGRQPGGAAQGNGEAPKSQTADASECGPLQVIGTNLCDSAGNPVQLKGISTHGLAWFPDYVNEDLFRELHEQWKVNVIRLAMYTGEYGGYCTGGDQEQLKKLIRDGVEYASAQNMYVIIDWHILSDGDPNTYKEEAKSFFGDMSAEFADRENIIYEICNEPNGGTGWSRVKEYAQEIIPIIRENDEDAVILVGTPNWCQFLDQAAADPITEWDNIMYTLHFYAATHKEDLRRTMENALADGLPVFVSEFSICDASGNGGIDETQADAWVELLDRYQVSYVAWNLSNKNETSALIKSACSKTSGLSAEDLSSTGEWLYGVLTEGEDSSSEGGLAGLLPGNPLAGGHFSGNREQSGQDRHPQENHGQHGTGQGDQQSQGNQGQNGTSQGSQQPQENQEQAGAAAAEDLQVTVALVNSWESNGKHFYQYEMTVENISDHAIDGWSTEVVFNQEPELSDSWNGVYTLDGKTLQVSAVDYNGKLGSGESTGNIGFIVSGGADLSP